MTHAKLLNFVLLRFLILKGLLTQMFVEGICTSLVKELRYLQEICWHLLCIKKPASKYWLLTQSFADGVRAKHSWHCNFTPLAIFRVWWNELKPYSGTLVMPFSTSKGQTAL